MTPTAPLMAVPQLYFQPNTNTHAAPQTGPDATAEFQQTLNDPSRWIIKQGVPVFKAHERIDPATGKLIKVDLPKLYRIAGNMQQMERGGVPIRLTLGHTEPGKSEVEQPPVAGYYKNPRVQAFGPKGEPAIVVDEWLDPQWGHKRKDFPYRSSEYYDDTEQITGVALLTRDPFLDLGVVAYQQGRIPTMYDRRSGQYVPYGDQSGILAYTQEVPITRALNPATGRVPVMYRLTLGEVPMYPPGTPTPGPVPQPMTSFLPQPTPYAAPQYPTAPVPPVAYAVPQPTPYAAPMGYAPPQPAPLAPVPYAAPPTPYASTVMGDWNTGYSRPSMQRSHPSQWNYGRFNGRPSAYADGPPGAGGPPGAPGGMGGGPGGPGGPGGGNPLETVYMCLVEATNAMQQLMASATQAPQQPFPGEGGPGGPPPTMASAYGRGRPQRRPRMYGNDVVPTGYGVPQMPQARPLAPTGYAAPAAPVGQQLKVDQLQYQLAQQNNQIRVLMYERDQADTQECIAEIRRLSAAGYPVDESEVWELKKTPRDQRPQFLERIAAKYQRVPSDSPPMLLGDPTPGVAPVDPSSRPASQEEMQQALQLSERSPEIGSFQQALNYIRSAKTGPTPYGGVNRIAGYPGANGQQPPQFAGTAPFSANGFDPSNPYPDLR